MPTGDDPPVSPPFSASFSERAEMLLPPTPWDRPKIRSRSGARVVLMHGLGRSWHAMEPLARRLDAAGFTTLNLPYPSTRKPLDEILRHVREKVAEFASGQPVHFVTHSLGGIIVRKLISENPPWETGRFVMIAPPNTGSEIIDWLSQNPLLKAILSPAALALATDAVPAALPALPAGLEAMVIMGKRSSLPFFRPILSGENDGIVSAERGRIPGLRGFTIVDAGHTFIQIHPDTVRQTIDFLGSGLAGG